VTTSGVWQKDIGSSALWSTPDTAAAAAAAADDGEDEEEGELARLRLFADAVFALAPFAVLLLLEDGGGGAMARSSSAVKSA